MIASFWRTISLRWPMKLENTAKPPSNQVHDLFAAYLEQVSRLAVAVDQMGKRP